MCMGVELYCDYGCCILARVDVLCSRVIYILKRSLFTRVGVTLAL